ncbi:hypothetical protein SAMN05216388_101012 [Halorientalis persicus]|jgi:hypothetical protein|uniref:DUF3784 domain-containing protein n=1 Tax=Halorientalis persicus TaxID=1367881 RepID=A0A1H8N4C9_9EURY|nr:DUF3784 domain-containing protein [Halorientalis persicus]SEO24444.1 hypothetical protein SAMN05216388_101012 [Halorientalis persicus]
MLGLPSIAVEYFGVAALLLVLGYLIRFREWTFLLAGYDETSPVPSAVAANVAGNTVLRIGVAALVVGGAYAVTNPPASLSGLFAAVVVLDVARLIYRLNTYSPDDADSAA